MGMRTVAEYVENDAIASVLTAMNVDFLQGYGLGKPVDAEEILSIQQALIQKTGT